jgi:DNA-binding response OmpR family regulator
MSGKRLLVVDDEIDFGNFVARVAEGEGYAVEVATRADEFMRLYESFDPTTIILDIVMPEKDGIELLNWLKERGTRAKIIFVTGHNPHYAEMAKLLGDATIESPVTSLNKPVPLETLRAALS